MSPKNMTIIDEDATDGAQAGRQAVIVDHDNSMPGTSAGIVDEDVNQLDRLPDNAVSNADGSVTLHLRFPQELQVKKDGKIGTVAYTELTFHRLTGADQRAIAAVTEDMMTIVAFSRSTRINQARMTGLFDKMDASDISAAGQVLNSFFATGRKTGR